MKQRLRCYSQALLFKTGGHFCIICLDAADPKGTVICESGGMLPLAVE